MENFTLLYDGTFYGLLSCVFECFEKKIDPFDITPTGEEGLIPAKFIETNYKKAERVKNGIYKKLGKNIFKTVYYMFLTCHPKKELLTLQYIRLSFKVGSRVNSMLADDTVNQILKAVRYLHRETHLFKGFTRFSDYNGALFAKIEPKNYCLPLLGPHFAKRLAKEKFLIFDKTHKQAFIYENYHYEIINIDGLSLNLPNNQELMYQNMWRMFYNTIAIKERENPKCRASHMPKRYWGNMTEFLPQDTPAKLEDFNQNKLQ